MDIMFSHSYVRHINMAWHVDLFIWGPREMRDHTVKVFKERSFSWSKLINHPYHARHIRIIHYQGMSMGKKYARKSFFSLACLALPFGYALSFPPAFRQSSGAGVHEKVRNQLNLQHIAMLTVSLTDTHMQQVCEDGGLVLFVIKHEKSSNNGIPQLSAVTL